MEDDLYAVLGVLPEADAAVITAAYRVLAGKYHPDKWTGDPAVAHERMVRLNRAYEVLRDPAARQNYDGRRAETRASFEQADEQSTAFEDGMRELEARWTLAKGVLPELEPLRKRLAKISYQLAFGFVSSLLETRRFKDAGKLADAMESSFLRRYFGTDPRIVQFAKELINLGHRGAVKSLNRLVDVLGSEIEAHRIILKVVTEFQIDELRQERAEAEQQRRSSDLQRDRLRILKNRLAREPYVDHARELIEIFGLKLDVEGGGFFKRSMYVVTETLSGVTVKCLPSGPAFVGWVKSEFSSKIPS